MKKIILIAVAFLLVTGVKAQLFYPHYPNAYYFPAPGPEKYYLDNQQKQKNDKEPGIRYGINVGTSYMSSGWFKGFSSWVAPTFSYSVSPKFYLSGGIMLQHSFPVNGSYPADHEDAAFGPQNTNMVLFGQGTYFIRPNLSLTGTVVKNLNRNYYRNLNISPFYRNYVPDSYSLRLNYRISDHLFFGAEFRYSEPSVYSPFYPVNVPPYQGVYPYYPH